MTSIRLATMLWLAFAAANASEPNRVVTQEDAGYVVRHWGVDDGLPNQAVYALAQDRDGYLWIGTDRGLVRFDGLDFESFALPGVSETASIVALFCDSRGRLWIAEKWGSLILYEDGKFRPVRPPTDETWAIWHMTEDPEGTLWFSGWYGGDVACFRDGRLEPAPVRLPAHTPVTGLGFGGDGQLLFSSEYGGAYLLQTGEGQRESPVPTRVGRALCQGPDGTSRIITKEGVCRLEESNPVLMQRFEALPEQGGKFVGQNAGGTLWHISRGNNGIEVFIGEPEGRNFRMEVRTPSQMPRVNSAPDEVSTYPNSLYSIAFLDDDSVWLGTSDGLFQFRSTLFRQPAELGRFTTGLNVSRIREDAAERLWFVTHQNSFCLDEGRTRLAKTAVSGGFAWLTEGESIWQAFGKKVANWRLDPADGQWRVHRHEPLPAVARCLHLTRGGDLWVGTLGGPCLRSPDGFTLQGPEVPVVAMASDPSDRIYALFADGSLRWGEDGHWHHISEGPTGKINALCVDEDGGLWVAGERPALARWKNGHWFPFDGQRIDWPQVALDVLVDDRGGLWLSTPNIGILWLNHRALDAVAEGREVRIDHKVFDINDGLPTAVCAEWDGGMTQTRGGKIWVTTESGPAVIDLDALQRTRETSTRQPIVIKEVRVDDASVEFRSRADGEPEAGAPLLEVRPGQQRIEFVFSAPNFSAPEQVRFRYRLDGLDLDWVNGGTVRSTHYRDLPPGPYRFHVAATNSYGVWNGVGTSLDVVVLPAWWQRRSSQGAAAVLALAAAGLAGWLAVRSVRRRSEAQERFAQRLIASQEQERQRIAGDLHDSLGQDLVLIKQALDIEALETGSGERGNRPARSSLFAVADLAGHAIERVRSITDDLSPPELGRMGLVAALEEMADRASEHAGIPVRCRVADLDRDWADDESINVYRIIQECLTNAIKHAEAQSIVISAKCRLDTLRVLVEDDGKGYNVNTPADRDYGAGHGLEGLKKRALMLGGTFLIRARPDRGTRCTLEIPLHRL